MQKAITEHQRADLKLQVMHEKNATIFPLDLERHTPKFLENRLKFGSIFVFKIVHIFCLKFCFNRQISINFSQIPIKIMVKNLLKIPKISYSRRARSTRYAPSSRANVLTFARSAPP